MSRKAAVRLYESQHAQVRLLGQLGADVDAICQIYGVSDTTARDSMRGLVSISTGRRDITGSVVFVQDPEQAARAVRYGELLALIHPEAAHFLWQLKEATEIRKPEMTQEEICEEVDPETSPEPEAVPDAPIYDDLVRAVGKLLEPSVQTFLEGLQRVATASVERAIDAWTRP